MEKMFKKFFYTGVGIVSKSAETLADTVNNWTEVRKESEQKGKEMVDNFVNEFEDKSENYESTVKNYVSNFIDNMKVPTKNEVGSMKAKIADLEKEIAGLQ